MNIRNKLYLGNLMYLLSMPFMFVSFIYALTEHWRRSNFTFLIVLLLVTFGTFAFCISTKKLSKNNLVQLAIVWLVIASLWDLSFLNMDENIHRSYIAYMGLVLVNANFCCFLIQLLLKLKTEKIGLKCTRGKEYIIITSFLLLFVLLNLTTLDSWFKSDSYTYYSSFLENIGKWNLEINGWSAFELAGHSAYGYTLFLFIIQAIFRNVAISVRITNIIFGGLTVFAFYRILKIVFKNLSKFQYYIILGIFTFSPLFFGIMYEMNTDYPMFCFFVWYVYSVLDKKKIFRILSSILLCFSKEIGVILLLAFIFGEYLIGFLMNKSYKREVFLRNLKDIALDFWGVFMWMAQMLLSRTGWANEAKTTVELASTNSINSIKFDFEFIFYKLKELFVLNFAWIPTIILVGGIVYFIVKRKRIKYIFGIAGIICSYTAFLAFNLLFFTYPHYRYLIIQSFFSTFLIAMVIDYVELNNLFKNIVLTVLAICYGIQCYITVDPLTLYCFDNVNVGGGNIITTQKYIGIEGKLYAEGEHKDYYTQALLDNVLYNREQLQMEETIEKLFSEIEYSEDDYIIVPPIYGSYQFTIYTIMGRANIESYFWDQSSKNIVDTEGIPVQWIGPESELKPYKNYYYIKFPYLSEFDHEQYLKQYNVLDQITVKKGQWVLEAYKVENKK